MGSKGIPACITDYTDGHAICNGDPAGKTKFDRLPCSWRERCIAFDRHLKLTGESLEEHVKLKPIGDDYEATAIRGLAVFRKFCDSLVEEFRVRGETSGPEDPEQSKAQRKNRRKKKRGPYAEVVERRRKRMFDLFNDFLDKLTDKMDRARVPKPGETEIPGQLYVIDRRKSGYLAVYCRTREGRDLPIVRADFRAQRMSFNVRLSISQKSARKFLGKVAEQVKVFSITHGQFSTELRDVSPDIFLRVGVSVGRAIRRGAIALPPVGER